MAVHAHPDDEATGTGGILARYSDEGSPHRAGHLHQRRVGRRPGRVKPEDPAHDERTLVPLRRAELEASCRILGVSDLELLGYHDSGMEGWPQNEAPDSFWQTPVTVAGHRLAGLMRALPAPGRGHL